MISDVLADALSQIREYQRECPHHDSHSTAINAVCETMDSLCRYFFTIPGPAVASERNDLLMAIGNLDLSAIKVSSARLFLALGCLYRSPTPDVEALAAALVELIRHRASDERLRWYDDGRVQVLVEKVLPFHLAGQSKRLQVALTELLTAMGWQEDKSGIWAQM